MIAVLLAAPAAPSRADDAGVVWVPLAPAGAPVTGPVVLVPFDQSIHLPEPGTAPLRWMPDYVSPEAGAAAADWVARRLSNLPRRDDFGLVGAGHDLSGRSRAAEGAEDAGDAGDGAAAPRATFSDVLRDVQWRRDTAERMRLKPGFRLPN